MFKQKLPKVLRVQLERSRVDAAVAGRDPPDWDGLINLVNDDEYGLSMLSSEEKTELFPALYAHQGRPVPGHHSAADTNANRGG